MKKRTGIGYLITTTLAGMAFLVPLGFLVYILNKAVGFMMVIAQPLSSLVPLESVGGIAMANLVAVLAVIVVCFFAGLIARYSLVGGLMKKLETNVLMKIPGYTVIKGLKSDFEDGDTDGMKPVALQLGSAERVGYEIEKLTDGRSQVFVPSAPNPWSGVTQVLPADQITYLNVPVKKIMELSQKYGHGIEDVLLNKAEDSPVEN